MFEEIKKVKFTLNYRYSIQEDPDTGVLTCLPEVRKLFSTEEIGRDEIKGLANYFKRHYAIRNDIDFEDVLCVVKIEKTEYLVDPYSED